MKLITTIALSLLGCTAYAQSTEVGFETGTIAYFNTQYFNSGHLLTVYKNWRKADFCNGVYLRRETKGRWAYTIGLDYYHDKNANILQLPPSAFVTFTNPNTPNLEFNNTLTSDILNYSLTLEYRLNKTRRKFNSYLGFDYTRLNSNTSYAFYQLTGASTKPHSNKDKWNDNLLGINYRVKYNYSTRLAFMLDLSAKTSTKYLNQTNYSLMVLSSCPKVKTTIPSQPPTFLA